MFPTPRRTPATAVVTDSLHRDSTPAVATQPTAPPTAVPAGGDSTAQRSDSTTATPIPGTITPEITTISTSTTEYRFSNVGAVPQSIAFNQYKSLTPGGGSVVLRTPDSRPLLNYSLVVRGDTIPLRGIPFELTRSEARPGEPVLTYQALVNGTRVTIAYQPVPDTYVLKINGRVDGVAGQSFLLVDLPTTLPATESDTLGDLRSLSYSFKSTRDNARGIPFGKLDPGESKLEPGPLSWAAVRNKYFVVGLLNEAGSAFDEMTITGGPRTSKVATTASATAVKALKDGAFSFEMYAGPQQSTQLISLGRDFDHVNPYGWSFLQPVVNPIAALCIKLLLWLHETFQLSYGWVLVLFGVVIRILLWPLNQSAMRSSLRMQELQPRLAEVQKKYKDKPEKQREEMMKVYKEAGASPFTALSGCLPMLIPMPVLFALFFVFQNTIEFRGVPFMWLPDISVKDPLYILPILMGISMYILSWIGLRNAPPNPQAKMMSYMFPVMMTFVLLNMASGLNLYYTAQNIAALPQQWLLARERLKARKAKT
jgi:YidC/Oxa1 family membrane protein insertase